MDGFCLGSFIMGYYGVDISLPHDQPSLMWAQDGRDDRVITSLGS